MSDHRYNDKQEVGLNKSEVVWSVFHGNENALKAALEAGDYYQELNPKINMRKAM